jgi:solute carrier family 34 (sodium-dependent phosphate cotransporter)
MAAGTGTSDRPSKSPLLRPKPRGYTPAWMRGIYAAICLYLFLSAINIMGSGLKVVGESGDWLDRLFAQGDNPLIALMGAVLVTAVVQSSSFTTALIITLVAAGDLKLGTAVFAIMGANIGTSVTGMLVSLGSNPRIKRQFQPRVHRRADARSCSTSSRWLMLFPLEWISGAWHDREGYGLLTRSAMWALGHAGHAATVENP